MTVEADAVARVFLAQQWLLEPEWISHGVWGPLHFYLIAIALTLGGDPEYAPIILNIFFAVATAMVLYAFATREFNASVGLFVAAAYSLCPLVFRNSLMALAEIPFAFFISLTMLQLSRAREGERAFGSALWGGLWLTCAGALRYEAWVLIPLYGALLWHKPRVLLLFLGTAALFPLCWMAGNYQFEGDPLYSVNWATHWQLDVEGYNSGVTVGGMLRRAMFFPQAVFTGLTPLVSACGLVGVWAVAWGRKKQSVWLLPLLAILLVFVFQAVNGSLLMRARYAILLVVMFLPFAGAGWYHLSQRLGHGTLIAWLAIGMMLPLSYAREALAFTGPARLTQFIPIDIAAIPRMGPRMDRFAALLRQQPELQHGGVILDFWGWEETYYAALIARVPATHLYLMPGGQNEDLDATGFSQWLAAYPTGLIVVRETTPNRHLVRSVDMSVLGFLALPTTLRLQKVLEFDELFLYRYTVATPSLRSPEPATLLRQPEVF